MHKLYGELFQHWNSIDSKMAAYANGDEYSPEKLETIYNTWKEWLLSFPDISDEIVREDVPDHYYLQIDKEAQYFQTSYRFQHSNVLAYIDSKIEDWLPTMTSLMHQFKNYPVKLESEDNVHFDDEYQSRYSTFFVGFEAIPIQWINHKIYQKSPELFLQYKWYTTIAKYAYAPNHFPSHIRDVSYFMIANDLHSGEKNRKSYLDWKSSWDNISLERYPSALCDVEFWNVFLYRLSSHCITDDLDDNSKLNLAERSIYLPCALASFLTSMEQLNGWTPDMYMHIKKIPTVSTVLASTFAMRQQFSAFAVEEWNLLSPC